MTIDNILVTTKKTAKEHHEETYDDPVRELGQDQWEAIDAGYEEHYDSLAVLEGALDEHDVPYDRGRTTDVDTDAYDMIISHGGDGTLLDVSRRIRDDTLVLGIRSDERSEAGLCEFVASDTDTVARQLADETYETAEWTRLEGTYNGRQDVALNELAVREPRTDSSDYIVSINGEEERQGATGFLVATGAGSTGWFSNVNGGQESFDSEREELRFIAREPMDNEAEPYNLRYGAVEPGDTLRIRSAMNEDKDPVVQYDGSREERRYAFPRGNEVSVRISDDPLHVVTNPER